MSPRTVTKLDSGWEFKQAAGSAAVREGCGEFLPVAQFPTNVHLDLLAHKLIPDPFMGLNENDVQWVGETGWIYRVRFPTPAGTGKGRKAVIVFEGLDTFATVTLNGKVVLETENMFVPERVDVTDVLKAEGSDGENEMVIEFDSAYLRGWKLVEKYPKHAWGVWNGDNSRLAVRKAQYHWGWDWGPALLTCGPWRPVYIEVYESRISDLQVDTEIPESLDSAKLTVSVATEGPASKVTVQVSLAGKEVASKSVEVKDGVAVAELNVDKPELWYPVRYGGQPLYTVKATLSDGDDVDTCSKKVGLRRALLIQRPLKEQPGTSFFFEVNGVPVFCGGSNWIPADNFIPRITPQKYRDWLQLVADGNQFMVRVWGGGIYEEDAFYSACDELGLLVWQDFMFGCGNYPAWPELLASIRREAEANVRRLRHHPCIVIWAGNNEDYQFAESYSLTYDLADKDPDSWLQTNFPARYIYEKLLPDVCAELCPRTPYHFGSPYGGVDTRDPTVGDIHQWNVWHGTQERYQDFDALSGRFVSEFGMQALPCVKTIESFLPLGKDDPDRYAQSRTLDHHNKAAGHERRLALYLVENMCYSPNPLEQYVYATQLMQAECLASAYRLWKRQWKGPGREYCAGALVWQINDCWPVTSWAIADFYLRPKMAYFTVRREMAPLSVGITRKEHKRPKDKYTRADITVTHTVEVWGSNLGLDDLTGLQCVVRAWDVETGRMTFDEVKDADLVLPANRSTEITSLDVPGDAPAIQTVVAAYVVEKASGKQLARYVNWPEPLKYLRLQRPTKLRAELVHGGQGEGGAVVEVDAEVPVKGLVLESDEEGVKFTDNLVDVVPGETLRIAVHGATVGKTKIDVRYLGML